MKYLRQIEIFLELIIMPARSNSNEFLTLKEEEKQKVIF
jgi:hypothetical protein